MSQSEKQVPNVEAGEEIVSCCPFCRLPFDNPMPCLRQIECREDVGGCGKTFLVRKY